MPTWKSVTFSARGVAARYPQGRARRPGGCDAPLRRPPRILRCHAKGAWRCQDSSHGDAAKRRTDCAAAESDFVCHDNSDLLYRRCVSVPFRSNLSVATATPSSLAHAVVARGEGRSSAFRHGMELRPQDDRLVLTAELPRVMGGERVSSRTTPRRRGSNLPPSETLSRGTYR